MSALNHQLTGGIILPPFLNKGCKGKRKDILNLKGNPFQDAISHLNLISKEIKDILGSPRFSLVIKFRVSTFCA